MQENKCPTCGSNAPHLHPAQSYGGEVSICADPYHQTITSQNTAETLASVNVLAAKLRGAPVSSAPEPRVSIDGNGEYHFEGGTPWVPAGYDYR